MNVETISMPRKVAAGLLAEYRAGLRSRASAEVKAEWKRVADAYAALEKGTPVLDLARSITGAGVDEKGRPKLAVVRADAVRCDGSTNWKDGERSVVFGAARARWSSRERRDAAMLRFEFRAPTGMDPNFSARAVVPMIPAQAVPTQGIDRRRHLILWEADWKDIPVDPMLLRPLGGSLFAVVAQWDLTEVERAVLRGRL